MYGFSRIESVGPGFGSYFHPSFQRCDQAKSLTIQRHSPTRKNYKCHRNASYTTTIMIANNEACIGKEHHQKVEVSKYHSIKNNTRLDREMGNNPAPISSSDRDLVDCKIGTFLNKQPRPQLCSGSSPCNHDEVGQEGGDIHHQFSVGLEVSSFEPRPIELMLQESDLWHDSCTTMRCQSFRKNDG